jgi:hypothetical protein
MIGLSFNGIRKDQLIVWMAKITEAWKNARGPLNWGRDIIFRSRVDREMEHRHLAITEWGLSFLGGVGPKFMLVFLFDANENTCEVFFSAVTGPTKYESKLAKAIKSAFEKLFPYR